ncbi:tetratricopeptide repeat protein [Clostridium sp. B9]|uniref:tetratricopeptide repeat protein n=1 Tax=Clostridium sp. B9 TaxID=3423224 RepID=UPI003D2F4BAA
MNKKGAKNLLNLLIVIGIVFFMIKVSLLMGSILLISFLVFKLTVNKHLIHMFKGAKELKSNNLKEALGYYRKAALCPNSNVKAIKTYVFLELKKGSYSEALETLKSIISKRKFLPEDANQLDLLQAILYWKLGETKTSLQILSDLKENNFKSLDFYEVYGYVLIQDEDFEKAISISKEGLKIDDLSQIIRANLGEIFYRIGDIEQACFYFNELIDECANFAEPYYFMGIISKEKDDSYKAKELLNKALKYDESILSNLSKNDIENALISINH